MRLTEEAPVLVRHPPERGRRSSGPVLHCCGCSCCCCCLHTLLGVVGGIVGSRGVATEPSRSERFGSRSPADGAALDADAAVVLGTFAVYWAATRQSEQGHLSAARFQRLGEVLRERVQAVWCRLFDGRHGEALQWILDRLPMLVSEDILPLASVPHFHEVFAGRSARSGAGTSGGPLEQLWRLHVLYMETAAAVAAGVVPATSLARVRRHVCQQALRSADRSGSFRGDYQGGRFSGGVLAEALRILEELVRDGVLEASVRESLEAALSGRDLPASTGDQRTCPICGDFLTVWPVVHCAACGTPQHEGCFSYNGRCASFACGCLDTLESLSGSGSAPRFSLEQGSSREAEAGPGARVAGLYWGLLALVVLACMLASPWLPLLLGPALQLGASLLTAIVVLFMIREGRGAALWQVGRITGWSLLGAGAGILLMVGLATMLK